MTHGKPALLHEEVGLTGDSVAERVLATLRSGEPRPQLIRAYRARNPPQKLGLASKDSIG